VIGGAVVIKLFWKRKKLLAKYTRANLLRTKLRTSPGTEKFLSGFCTLTVKVWPLLSQGSIPSAIDRKKM
jgi:hypothetical protein